MALKNIVYIFIQIYAYEINADGINAILQANYKSIFFLLVILIIFMPSFLKASMLS